MKKGKNIFEDLQYSPREEKIDEIFQISNKKFRVERILSSSQISQDWYDQEEEEYIILLEGKASILYETGEEVWLESGDSLFLPAHKKHKVSFTSDRCLWLCIFFT